MTETAIPLSPWRQALRDSKALILLEFAIVAAVFVADEHNLIYFSKTPYLLSLGWLSMALRGVTWRDVGLRWSGSKGRIILYGVIAGALLEQFELFVQQPLLVRLTGKYPDISDFKELVGNPQLLLTLIALSWVVAGFGEEMVWRGYMLNRWTDLTGRSRAGWIVSLVILSAAFGLAHMYQGITGIAENTIAGLTLGGLYLLTNRNLVIPIIAHSIIDTLDFIIIYFGLYPGM